MVLETLDAVQPREVGRRLKAARTARGLTQEEVARRLGVARTTVTAMEAGDRKVKPGELAALARLYGRSIGELVLREEPTEPFTVQFRSTLQSYVDHAKELDGAIFEFQRLCEDHVELERIRGAMSHAPAPPQYQVDEAHPERAAEDIANRERQRLGLGDAPVLELRTLLETDVGLRIFYLPLPSRVAAMFAFSGEFGACVAVNRNHPPERRRQSLAHEFGHFLTDRYRPEVTVFGRYERVPARERFAETFGRAFLLPATGLARRFNEVRRTRSGKVTPADLCVLAHFFFVSVEAMTRRLEELDLIPPGTWDRLRQQGFRVADARQLLGLPEPRHTDHPLPTRYLYLAAEAFRDGDLSEGQLARFLRMDRVAARQAISAMSRQTEVSEEGEVESESLDLTAPI